MKSYEEMTESVLKRRDNYISEKKIKMKKVKRAAVSVICVSLVCLCAVLIAGEIRNKPVPWEAFTAAEKDAQKLRKELP